jgi:hypothetical protein
VCPMCKIKCKIVSYVIKTFYLILGHHFYFRRKVTCPHIFCTETVCCYKLYLQRFQSKVECFLEYLSFSAVKNIKWFTYYRMSKKVSHNRCLYPISTSLKNVPNKTAISLSKDQFLLNNFRTINDLLVNKVRKSI